VTGTERRLDIVFAIETRLVTHPAIPGGSLVIRKAQHWPADDPIVKAYPQCFADDPRYGLTTSLELDEDGYPVMGGGAR